MSIPRSLRWYVLTGAILLPVLVYGSLIGWAYRHPPLRAGMFSQSNGPVPVLGIELENTARFAAVLDRITFEGGEPPAEAVVVASPSAVVAENYAIYHATADMEHWPLQGWRLAPNAPRYKYAIRAQWPTGTPLPSRFAIRYRYLGWPLSAWIVGNGRITWPKSAGRPATELDTACAAAATDSDRTKVLGKVASMPIVSRADQAAVEHQLESAFGSEWQPMALSGDLDGDGQADLVAAFGRCSTPVMVFLAARGYKEPVLLPAGAADAPWQKYDGNRISLAGSGNGDSRAELAVERREVRNGATYLTQTIYQWQGDRFVSLDEILRKN